MKSEPMDPVAVIAVIGSFVTSISALILGLAGIWAQNRRDAKQAKIDQDKADKQDRLDKERLDMERDKVDDEARQATMASMKSELDRLHENEKRDRDRIQELENTLIDKTAKIGELMIAKINAESEAATMKYKMEAMQMRLNELAPKEIKKKKEETVPLAIRQTLEENETRKALVQEETNKEIETLKSGSIANGPLIEGE